MENALTVQETAGRLMAVSDNMFFNVQLFEHAQRVAKMLGASTMVPAHFQGPQNIGNVLIALNYAQRIQADVFMVMQSLYVVHGRPGLEGKLVIALVNQCGRFEPLEFEEDKDGCLAFAKEIKSGKILKGPKVTWQMVKAEGWLDKNGSKWKSMSEVMFRYRAAAFFARTYCPEVMLGMQTKEEIEDFVDMQPVPKSTAAWEPAPPPANDFDFDTYRQALVDRGIASTEQLDRFVAALAAHYKKPLDEVQGQIAGDPEGFEMSLTKWVAKNGANTGPAANKQASEPRSTPTPTKDMPPTPNVDPGPSDAAQEQAEEPKDERREEYINLRSAGFSTFVHKHWNRIHNPDIFSDEHRAEIKEKWAKLYPETPWPVKDGQNRSEQAKPDENGNGKVWCSRQGQWKPAQVCELKCSYVKGCEDYAKHVAGGEAKEQMVACPDEDGAQVPVSMCETCKAREGCPAWDDGVQE